jgi:TolB-like protein
MTTIPGGSLDVEKTHAAAILAASILVLSSAPCATAQEQLAGRRACVLTIQNLSAGDQFDEYETSITDSIEQELAAAGARIVASSTWVKSPGVPQEARDLLRGPIALAVAADVGADFVVNGSYTVDGEQILVSVQCWDVASRAPVSGFLRSWRFNLAFYNSLHEEVAGRFVPKIAARGQAGADGSADAAGTEAGAPRPARTDVTFLSSQDGVEVLIEGDAPAGTVENGRLNWSAGALPKGSKLRVQKTMEGFHPGWQTVRVAPEVALSPLVRRATKAVEIDWTLGQLVGLGATIRNYRSPDWVYRWAAGYLSMQLPPTSAGTPYFHCDTGLGIGSYVFLPPGSPVRICVAAGAGIIWSLQPMAGAQMFTDFYVNPLSWAVEAKLRGVNVFLRQEMKYTLGFGDNLLGRDIMMVGSSFPPVTVGVLFRR